jgi:hypothetical protein
MRVRVIGGRLTEDVLFVEKGKSRQETNPTTVPATAMTRIIPATTKAFFRPRGLLFPEANAYLLLYSHKLMKFA